MKKINLRYFLCKSCEVFFFFFLHLNQEPLPQHNSGTKGISDQSISDVNNFSAGEGERRRGRRRQQQESVTQLPTKLTVKRPDKQTASVQTMKLFISKNIERG